MESFRKLIKGWLGKVLLVLFLTPLALVGIEGYFGGGNKDGIAKTVNDLEISNKELEVQTKNYKDQFLQMVQGDESLLNQSYIEQMALDSLIDRALLVQQAEKLGISLSDAQIEQMIAQQPSLQVDGKFSQQAYENYLRSINMTSQGLIQNLRQDHALQMLVSSIRDNSLVSQSDIQQIANLQGEQRTLFMSSVKLDDYKTSVKITDAEVAAYYEKHKVLFKQPASVDLDYVLVTPAMVANATTTVTDAELKQAYDQYVTQQNKNAKVEVQHILITTDNRTALEAEKIANEVYAKIKSGLSFAEAAQQYSEDSSSKDNAGRVDGYEAGVFGDAFDNAVQASKGTISKPVKTDFGVHIIQAKADQVSVASFESEKARLEADLLKSKNANAYSDLVNGLNELVVSSDALDVVPQELKSAKLVAANNVTLATQNTVLADPAVKSKIFSQDVKNGDRNATSNIQLANGDTVWLKVREYREAGVQPLSVAKAKVKEKLLNQKAYEAAQAKVAAMLKDFKTLPSQQVLTKHQQSFVNAGVFTRSQGLKREIERAAFSVPAPKAGMWSVTTAQLPNEMVIIGVAEVKKPSMDSISAEEKQQLAQLYQNYRGTQLLKDYTEYLKSVAKIK
ncbi:SurA N-terminal domain-containing protein [Acinetobacter sp. YH12239]|uniref:SurA N-terminal domain-containing protein n=1 Tax=Acinetobacter sp. YH12239 TaxID=2601166 RepID=UPI0015D1FBB9|nr:SurA N-terminal domain-containing protein [Acinetobacter sp. YH12239]